LRILEYSVYYIMGVSGSGKSTIGKMLADKLDCTFLDGDDFHSGTNISKMKSGSSLSNDDRSLWLSVLNKQATENLKKACVVIACSALKEEYRRILQKGISDRCHWIYLKGSYETIAMRINGRKEHFMPVNLLQSQFDILEEPSYGICINVQLSPSVIIKNILKELGS